MTDSVPLMEDLSLLTRSALETTPITNDVLFDEYAVDQHYRIIHRSSYMVFGPEMLQQLQQMQHLHPLTPAPILVQVPILMRDPAVIKK